jgi:hypothetical protein
MVDRVALRHAFLRELEYYFSNVPYSHLIHLPPTLYNQFETLLHKTYRSVSQLHLILGRSKLATSQGEPKAHIFLLLPHTNLILIAKLRGGEVYTAYGVARKPPHKASQSLYAFLVVVC